MDLQELLDTLDSEFDKYEQAQREFESSKWADIRNRALIYHGAKYATFEMWNMLRKQADLSVEQALSK